MVEEMLAARGICVSYETVRRWANNFGRTFSDQIRRRCPDTFEKGLLQSRCNFSPASASSEREAGLSIRFEFASVN
jgi:hypothetical protein